MKLPADLELSVLQPPKPRQYGPDNPPPGLGRPKGSINKITADLKAGIMDGAAAYGFDGAGLGGVEGYLAMCAAKYPKHYMVLLGKLLPLQVNNDVAFTGPAVVVNIVGIPRGRKLSPEEAARLSAAGPTIEHAEIENTEPAAIEEAAPPAPRFAALEAKLAAMSDEQLRALAEIADER
jgi:hypothetical protein